MNLQPLEDRIVVRPGEAEETTVSGLVIPDTAKEKPQQGEVLAVGPGRRSEQTGELIPVDVAVGDIVLYSKYGGTEVDRRRRGPPRALEPRRARQGRRRQEEVAPTQPGDPRGPGRPPAHPAAGDGPGRRAAPWASLASGPGAAHARPTSASSSPTYAAAARSRRSQPGGRGAPRCSSRSSRRTARRASC